jgi:hypothetical protein
MPRVTLSPSQLASARAGELYRLNPATLAFELVEKIELKSSPGSVGDKTQPDRCEPMKQPD